ncbi:MFS general substrate transporter, partial [Coniophora puteana RWD-64-598 SS2]
FLIALGLIVLDQTILATALPVIASHFDAVSDLSWIASAYFLPQAAFMLFFGRILTVAPAKYVFLVTISLFELGSLFCAIAPSVNFLIFGRAFAGLGASGLLVCDILSLRISTLIEPRWCFYINLPFGGVCVASIAVFLPKLAPDEDGKMALNTWYSLDWIGTILSFAMVTFFLIPLQWGGVVKPWSSPIVIALLTLSGVFTVAFLLWEHHQEDGAMLPTSVFFQRNIFCVCFFGGLSFVLVSVSMSANFCRNPIFYQSKGHSAVKSGVDILPFIIVTSCQGLFLQSECQKTGYAWPFVLLCPMIASAGFGLLYTAQAQTDLHRIIGYQILVGVGIAGSIQLPMVIAQGRVSHDAKLISIVTSLVSFSQLMGCTVGLAYALLNPYL